MEIKFISTNEINRIINSFSGDQKLKVAAELFRINTLYMVSRAGSGHLGSSFSSMDIMTWLWLEEMKDPNGESVDSDIFFSSKGHDAPGMYTIMIGVGKLPEDNLHSLRRLNGLPGHPDIGTPYIKTNTGSLGMGISKAAGFSIARSKLNKSGRIFVLTGDGELQEGQIWESLQPVVNAKINNLVVIVDHNKIQSDTWVKDTSDLGDLETKFKAFGWHVGRADGNDITAMRNLLRSLESNPIKRPIIIIADTVKGKGVSFMQALVTAEDGTYYKFHSGAPKELDYQNALNELNGNLTIMVGSDIASEIKYNIVEIPDKVISKNPQHLVSAYSDELLKLADNNKKILAMDADLVLDTGLIPFKNKFPDRYFECGIAEQHMVSMAGTLALEGFIPIVHSFACFLTTRAQEQIFNNATEKTKIIYVGSLAGVLPSGPGHSHQSLRDVWIMENMPGMTVIEPACEWETREALRWAVDKAQNSVYIRLTSIPVGFNKIPDPIDVEFGRGILYKGEKGPLIIACGVVMLSEALVAYEMLKDNGIDCRVISAPWWNEYDDKWWAELVGQERRIFVLQNTNVARTFDRRILAQFSTLNFKVINVTDIPPCGNNSEVLQSVSLNAENISNMITESS